MEDVLCRYMNFCDDVDSDCAMVDQNMLSASATGDSTLFLVRMCLPPAKPGYDKVCLLDSLLLCTCVHITGRRGNQWKALLPRHLGMLA
nr:hypothetical protein CFP56_21567 [Quercus suber]